MGVFLAKFLFEISYFSIFLSIHINGDRVKLKGILKRLRIVGNGFINYEIKDCFSNSLVVCENSIFVCLNNGFKYVDEAIRNGANTIISEHRFEDKVPGINYINVLNSKKVYAQIINVLHGKYLRKMKIIGVSGTNGKTTVSTLVAHFLAYKGINSLFIGTGKIEYLNKEYKTNNTTPDIKLIALHARNAYLKGIRYIVMEVSSISIMELRVLGIKYDIYAVTNINQDHLDYHKDMQSYTYAKLIPAFNLKTGNKRGLVVNFDEEYSHLFMSFYEGMIITYGLSPTARINANLSASHLEMNLNEQVFRLNNIVMHSYLIGEFNTYNILCLAGIAEILGYTLLEIKDFLKYFYDVPGRMNVIGLHDKTVVIDYAHTPYSVLNVLKTLKSFNPSSLVVVIGAGGNRDKDKRLLIGQTLCLYCDKIFLTNDNPRDEDESSIVLDIAKGIDGEYEIILNRSEAIRKAIMSCPINGIVAIIGKGAEDRQIFKDKVVKYSDLEEVKKIIGGL